MDRLAVRTHQLGLTLFESPALVARRVHPARSPHAAGTAAVDARRRADVAQDGADPLVERPVVPVVDLQPAQPVPLARALRHRGWLPLDVLDDGVSASIYSKRPSTQIVKFLALVKRARRAPTGKLP